MIPSKNLAPPNDRILYRRNEKQRKFVEFHLQGRTIQMHQLEAFGEKRSTWKIKTDVLG